METPNEKCRPCPLVVLVFVLAMTFWLFMRYYRFVNASIKTQRVITKIGAMNLNVNLQKGSSLSFRWNQESNVMLQGVEIVPILNGLLLKNLKIVSIHILGTC